MKVLIVEDIDSDRKLLSINMRYHGWEVLEATNGVEAMEILSREKPDLIVSDILMPKMDGFELIWSIKQREDTKSIPFIFYSAIYTGEKDKLLAIALGAEAFIEKPKEPEELFETIVNVYRSIKEVKLPDMRLIMEEEEFLKAYSYIVAAKLDEKVRELTNLNKKYLDLYNEYKTLIDSIPDSICLLDDNLRIQWVNKAFEKAFNRKIDELIGVKCYLIIKEEDSVCEKCIALKVFETCDIEIEEFKAKNGRIWDVRAIPVKNQEGKTVNVIEIIRDITEQKKLQQQLIHAQRMEAIGILAGGIAHDFKNMLTPIMGFAQLIKMQVSPESPIYNYADKIYSAGEKASSLAQGLLTFSRKQLLDIRPVNIDSLIKEFSEIIVRIIGEDIELKLNLNSGKGSVLCDITQIKQVLINLVTNARDAMPKGGVLIISTEILEIDENFTKSHGFGKPGKYVVISVSDTGIGMDEKTKARIFEPFFTTKSPDKGTGLGLAIVYGIVRQHSGYIDVYSELGFGSTFKIYLPLSEVPLEEKIEREQRLSELIHGNGELILIIEDDENVRNYFKIVLEEAKYRVIEARNGVEGVEKYLENRDNIKLVILDLIMPLKNGKETLDEIKKINPAQKYIFVSGYPAEIMFEKGIIDREIEFLNKPISPTLLLQKIKEVLSS